MVFRIASPPAWAPVAAFVACLSVAAVAAVLGHRALDRAADTQLSIAGRYAAHHLGGELVARLRAVEGAATIDAQSDATGGEREELRDAAVASLARLHPELPWIGFVDAPGRVAVAHRDLLEGVDVSDRDWWRAAQLGPWLGGVHDARLLATALARPGVAEPARLLDIAVPLRRHGRTYGVLAAHVDARWLLQLRDDLGELGRALTDVDVVVLERDGTAASGPAVSLDPAATGLQRAVVDGRPRVASVHRVGGDVVVARMGWRLVVARDPTVHGREADAFAATALATGAIVGLLAAVGVGAMQARRAALA